MKNKPNLLIIIINIMLLTIILFNKNTVSKTILLSLNIWLNNLLPSMLPMFITSDILITYHFEDYLPKSIIKITNKLFNLSSKGSVIFILSLISGFPINAINIKKELDLNNITNEEACHLIMFANFANPLFILETVGVLYLKNNKYGILLLIIHILSNIILGIIFRHKKYPLNNYISNKNNCQNFIKVLNNTLKKTIDNLLMIAASITIFLVLTTLIINIFKLEGYPKILIEALMEMSTGLYSISKEMINIKTKMIISSCILSFNGLAIHLQIMSVLEDNKLYLYYLKGRIIESIISVILTLILV